MHVSFFIWILFIVFVIAMIILDLKVFHRKSHQIKIKEALIWSAVWIAIALIFNYGIYVYYGQEKALEFLTGYLLEKSLSVDNLFVFIMIFTSFGILPKYQHKVLFWGIIGALVMRAVFIFAGVAIVENFDWVFYLFGAFLIYSGIKMFYHEDKVIDPTSNRMTKILRKFFPIAEEMHEDAFFIKINYKYFITPLFVVLILIELSDIVFAADSIPAILAISKDPFIIFTSNAFAILGLRALYFAIAGIVKYFYYLKYALGVILVFVGIKMLIHSVYKIETLYSLFVIFGLLIVSVIVSLCAPKKE